MQLQCRSNLLRMQFKRVLVGLSVHKFTRNLVMLFASIISFESAAILTKLMEQCTSSNYYSNSKPSPRSNYNYMQSSSLNPQVPHSLHKIYFSHCSRDDDHAKNSLFSQQISQEWSKQLSSDSDNLIWANGISALYLLIESWGRQCEIALYQLNNTSLIVYNMARRRGFVGALAMGECLMFGLSIMVISYFYFNGKQAFRKNYIQTIFDKLIGEQ